VVGASVGVSFGQERQKPGRKPGPFLHFVAAGSALCGWAVKKVARRR
jgi:hypothetical protein